MLSELSFPVGRRSLGHLHVSEMYALKYKLIFFDFFLHSKQNKKKNEEK